MLNKHIYGADIDAYLDSNNSKRIQASNSMKSIITEVKLSGDGQYQISPGLVLSAANNSSNTPKLSKIVPVSGSGSDEAFTKIDKRGLKLNDKASPSGAHPKMRKLKNAKHRDSSDSIPLSARQTLKGNIGAKETRNMALTSNESQALTGNYVRARAGNNNSRTGHH